MTFWYPNFPPRQLPTIIRIAAVSALVTGIYGALHDQVSYSIAPEYFTKLKFKQFHWADLSWPPRVFAALVGFLATWWVGLIGGWLLARYGLAELAELSPRRYFARAFECGSRRDKAGRYCKSPTDSRSALTAAGRSILGSTFADAHAGRARRRKDRPIIDLQCGLVLAELNVKQ